MIEVRLRAAGSNPSSLRWRWGVSLVALTLAVVAPVATSRAQDAPRRDLESLRAMKVVNIDGGEAIAITSGAASITLKRDGTVIIKGTEIVIDNGKSSAKASSVVVPSTTTSPSSLNARSEVF
jgi:hypothetical protein